MGLTWRDAVSSFAILVIVIAYAAYLGGTTLLLISSTWAMSAVVLVLGIGCAVVAASDLYTRPQPRLGEGFRRIGAVTAALGYAPVQITARWSPQVAAGEDVDERHERDKAEDGPGQFRASCQFAAGCQVDPHENDGEGMDETDDEFQKLLHFPESTHTEVGRRLGQETAGGGTGSSRGGRGRPIPAGGRGGRPRRRCLCAGRRAGRSGRAPWRWCTGVARRRRSRAR